MCLGRACAGFPLKTRRVQGGACPPQARDALSPGEGRRTHSAFSGAGHSTRPAFSGQARCTGGAGRLLPMVQCAPAHGPTGPSACQPHPRLAHTLVSVSLRTRPGHSSRATPLKRALAIPARHRPHAQSAACLGRAYGGFPLKTRRVQGGACPPQARSAFSPGEGRLSRSAFSGAGRSTRPAFSGKARCTGGAGRHHPMVQCAPAHGPTGPSACRPHPRLAHTFVKVSRRIRPGHFSRATELNKAHAIPARHGPHAPGAQRVLPRRPGDPRTRRPAARQSHIRSRRWPVRQW